MSGLGIAAMISGGVGAYGIKMQRRSGENARDDANKPPREVPLTGQEQQYVDIFNRFMNQGSPGNNFVGNIARENVMQNPSPQFNFSPTGVSGRNPGTQFYRPPQGGVDWASIIQRWREQFSQAGQQPPGQQQALPGPLGGGGGGFGPGRPTMAPRY